MTEFGYWLSSEEHRPGALVDNAARAEELGFSFAMISDHFHPWIDAQGQSPFVWSVLGGIAATTEWIALATGVTCPLIRTHPAIVAHAAATCGAMLPGRFTLGLGTGENLNEHIHGDRWPAPDERVEILEEAIEVIRLLWKGGEQTHRGKHYTVDHARLYTLPEEPVPIAVAAAKPNSAELAGRLGDALVNTVPDEQIVKSYRGRRQRAVVRPGPTLLGRRRGGGERDGVSALAPQRPRRDDQPGAAVPVRLRSRRGNREQRDGNGGRPLRAGSGTSARANPELGAAATTSPSTRSAQTRKSSSASGNKSSNPSSERNGPRPSRNDTR